MLFGDRIKRIVSFQTHYLALPSTVTKGEACRRQRHQFLHRRWPFFLSLKLSLFRSRCLLLLSSLLMYDLQPNAATVIHTHSPSGYSKLFREMLEVTKWSEDDRLRNSECNTIVAAQITPSTCTTCLTWITVLVYRRVQGILWTSPALNLPSKLHFLHTKHICGTY